MAMECDIRGFRDRPPNQALLLNSKLQFGSRGTLSVLACIMRRAISSSVLGDFFARVEPLVHLCMAKVPSPFDSDHVDGIHLEFVDHSTYMAIGQNGPRLI